MLYSRALKARIVTVNSVGDNECCTDAADVREDGGPSKTTRVEHTSEGASGLLGQSGCGRVVGAGGEGGGLKAVVESLISLEVEGVFSHGGGLLVRMSMIFLGKWTSGECFFSLVTCR